LITAQDKVCFYGAFTEETPNKYELIKTKLKNPKISITGLVLTVFLVCTMLVYFYSQVYAIGIQLNRLEKEVALLRIEKNDLESSLNKLSTIESIEHLAINKFGMVKPEVNNIIVHEIQPK